MSTETALLNMLTEKIRQDALILPTLPEIAIKIRDVADDPTSTLHDISRVVGMDAALSARIIRVANTAYNSRSAVVDSVSSAVFRIGLRAIKNVAIAMALEQLFISSNPIIKSFLRRIWHQSITVASAAVAASDDYLQLHKRSSITRDRLALACLLHEIGALPILTEAEVRAPDQISHAFLTQVIDKLSCTVGVHIIRHWRLGEDFAKVVWQWRNPAFQSEQVDFLDFVRVGYLYYQYAVHHDNVKEDLEYYADKGVIPSTDLFLSQGFLNRMAQERLMYE